MKSINISYSNLLGSRWPICIYLLGGASSNAPDVVTYNVALAASQKVDVGAGGVVIIIVVEEEEEEEEEVEGGG